MPFLLDHHFARPAPLVDRSAQQTAGTESAAHAQFGRPSSTAGIRRRLSLFSR